MINSGITTSVLKTEFSRHFREITVNTANKKKNKPNQAMLGEMEHSRHIFG